jgi:putative ABC transport system ATP-binding protein
VPEMSLAVRNASVSYGNAATRCQALDDVSIDFLPGTLSLIMGPSGSGKTTLLSLLGCLLTPNSGQVYVKDKEVSCMSERKRTDVRRDCIGYVFQAFRLFDALSAEENITVAAQIAGIRSRSARRIVARKLLVQFGLDNKAGLKPNELSGGEKQRVAIARALVKNPSILLADEPSASLDSSARQEIARIFRDLANREKMTVVVVSHDDRWEADAHRKIMLRDGRIV